MQMVLVMFRSDGQRRSFSIHKDITVLGRREDCDVRIPLSEISRKHCRVIREENKVRVEDLGSSNGTFVNGQRVQQATLAAGDTLRVGPVAFVIQLDGQPPEEALKPYSAPVAQTPVARQTGSGDEQQTLTMHGPGGEFDPSAILGGPEDSGANDAVVDSSVAHDIAADLERANRRR